MVASTSAVAFLPFVSSCPVFSTCYFLSVKDMEHKEDDKPEVAERNVKDKEHKEDDKE